MPAGAGDHAGTIALAMFGDPSRLLILMRDGVLWPPVLTSALDDDEGGRGLVLVDALATAWHWYHPPRPHGGKVVWALLTATEGTDMYHCTCGYVAADSDGLNDHLAEMIGPDDDRDPAGLEHAEVIRESPDSGGPYRCLCGHEATGIEALDQHLLAAFDYAGRDGLKHSSAGPDAA